MNPARTTATRRRGALPLGIAACLGCQNDPPATRSEPPVTMGASASAMVIRAPSPSHTAPAPPLHASSHPYAGGVWASCLEGFRTSNQPHRDVTRLSFLCAPYQGMSRLGRTRFGRVSATKDTSYDAALRKGQCARVFAVAENGLPAFRLTVTDPDGRVVAAGTASRGFVAANPSGAFCVDTSGSHRIRVTAGNGQGLVASEVWTLPEG